MKHVFLSLTFFSLLSCSVLYADMKVLLCSGDLLLQITKDSSKAILPGEIIKGEGILIASGYPAYIAVYDFTGKFLEKSINAPVSLKKLDGELQRQLIKPAGKALLDASLRNLNGFSPIDRLSKKYNKYKSLSHLRTMGPDRCPNPDHEFLGFNQNRMGKKVYTLYIYSDKSGVKDHLFSYSQNLFEEALDTFQIENLKEYSIIKVDMTDQRYHDVGCLINLKDTSAKASSCDSKLGLLISEENEERRNLAVKNLLIEFSDENSLLTKFLRALLYEDYEMYFDSAEEYIEIHDKLKGKNTEFNQYLFFYLLSPYLSYGLYDKVHKE